MQSSLKMACGTELKCCASRINAHASGEQIASGLTNGLNSAPPLSKRNTNACSNVHRSMSLFLKHVFSHVCDLGSSAGLSTGETKTSVIFHRSCRCRWISLSFLPVVCRALWETSRRFKSGISRTSWERMVCGFQMTGFVLASMDQVL